MDVSDIYKLGVGVVEKLGRQLVVPYLGGNTIVEEAQTQLIKLTDSLLSSYWNNPYGEHLKIDKKWERSVKQAFYEAETLLRKIEAFLEEGEHPDPIHNSFRQSTISQMEVILDTIKLFPSPLPVTYTSKRVVGREYKKEVEKLIALLLDSKSKPVLPILGKPGSGKSTLARLALDTSRVRDHFDSKAYITLTYISCQDIFCQAIQNMGRGMMINSDWPVQLHSLLDLLKRADQGSRCVLLLDGLTDMEILKSLLSINKKDPLYSAFLEVAARGVKIVITSSLEFVGSSAVSLPSLDRDESISLFKSISLKDQAWQHRIPPDIYLQICQECENIPSVINVIASILSMKSTPEEWVHFLHVVMTSVPNPAATVSSIFVLTELHCHHQIQRHWRHCFAWCSLLPKDYEFGKDYIFRLWRSSDDFLGDNGLTEEELNKCFQEFLIRGYFVQVNRTGSVMSYKINYLVSELMKYVAGDDFCLMDSSTTDPNNPFIRHASFIVNPSWEPPSWLSKALYLRSLFLWPCDSAEFVFSTKLESTLLSMPHLHSLHDQMVHPASFSIFLFECERLECLRLCVVSFNPPSTKKLPKGDPEKASIGKSTMYKGEEERLALIVKFIGFKKLMPQFEKPKVLDSLVEGSKITWSFEYRELTSINPHQTLESVKGHSWKRETLSTWVAEEFSLIFQSLVSIQIVHCNGCQHLPGFDSLPLLSSLILGSMYFLVDIAVSGDNTEACSSTAFYPSLKYLLLCDLPEFRGWSIKEADNDQGLVQQCRFPLLAEVKVRGCPKLSSMPSVPLLKSLEAINVDANILSHMLYPPPINPPPSEDNEELTGTLTPHLSLVETLELDCCNKFDWGDQQNDVEKGVWHALRRLNTLKLTNIPDLAFLPGGLKCVTALEQLSLYWLTNLIVLPDWIGQFTQLRQLTIHYCLKLKMLPNFNGLEQLEVRYCPRLSQFPESFPNLRRLRVQEFSRLSKILSVSQNVEELEIDSCEELSLEGLDVGSDHSVRVLEGLTVLHSLTLTNMEPLLKVLDFEKLIRLRQLIIQNCSELEKLPESLCSLTDLDTLQIWCCPGLMNLPQPFPNLRSLTSLEIRDSPQLEKRCETPNCPDWNLIENIANVKISDNILSRGNNVGDM